MLALQAKQRHATIIIRRFFDRVWILNHSRRVKRAFVARKEASYSFVAGSILLGASADPNCAYSIPGIRQNSSQFAMLLNKKTVLCDGLHASFAPFDAVMLAQVLRHSSCAIQTLILAHIDDGIDTAYEFDLQPAIAACRSLRCLLVLGGTYRRTFLCGLLSDIQTENPRIKEVDVVAVAAVVAVLTVDVAVVVVCCCCSFSCCC